MFFIIHIDYGYAVHTHTKMIEFWNNLGYPHIPI